MPLFAEFGPLVLDPQLEEESQAVVNDIRGAFSGATSDLSGKPQIIGSDNEGSGHQAESMQQACKGKEFKILSVNRLTRTRVEEDEEPV